MAIALSHGFSSLRSHFFPKSEDDKTKTTDFTKTSIGVLIDLVVAAAATVFLGKYLVRHLGMPVGLAQVGLELGVGLGPLGLIALFESAAYKVRKCVADRADQRLAQQLEPTGHKYNLYTPG